MAQQPSDPMRGPPTYNFTSPDSLTDLKLSMKGWLEAKNKHYDGLMTSAIVFNPQGRVLLVKRAAHDSMPNKWEPPGGAVDLEDESILHACVRELWEEGGLTAKRIVSPVPESGEGTPVASRGGSRMFLSFKFVIEVEGDGSEASVDPSEHSQLTWATEEQVREMKFEDGSDMPMTGPMIHRAVLDGFRIHKKHKADA